MKYRIWAVVRRALTATERHQQELSCSMKVRPHLVRIGSHRIPHPGPRRPGCEQPRETWVPNAPALNEQARQATAIRQCGDAKLVRSTMTEHVGQERDERGASR